MHFLRNAKTQQKKFETFVGKQMKKSCFKKLDYLANRSTLELISDYSKEESTSRNDKVSQINRNDLKIFCLNIHGLASQRLEIGMPLRNYIDFHKPDIFAIVETMTARGRLRNLSGYKLLSKDSARKHRKGRGSGGIGVYVKSHLFSKLICARIKNSMSLWYALKTKGDGPISTLLWIIVVYCRPTKIPSDRETMYKKWNKKMSKLKQKYREFRHNFLFIGDFNCRLGSVTGDSDHNGKLVVDCHGNHFMEFMKKNGLSMLNMKFDQLQDTYIGTTPLKGTSKVDYALCDNLKIVKNFRVELSNLGSDHRLLETVLHYKHKEKVVTPVPKYRIRVDYPASENKLPLVISTVFADFEKFIEKISKSAESRKQKMEMVYSNFEFRLDLCTAVGFGLSFQKYWHSEHWTPKIGKMECEIADLTLCRP